MVSQPSPPDPYATAAAQNQQNQQASQYSSAASNANEINPYGTVSYNAIEQVPIYSNGQITGYAPRYQRTTTLSPDQQKLLSEEIQERVVSIFEACNFQDLTGQRINKVMTTMKFIENHITVMMDIWGGVDAIKAHAPAIIDDREGDAKLLNGPKLDGDEGHASQNDIDALFD